MNNPLVSVVVPVYKNPEWVQNALDSLVKQSYPNLEILVVNDGSPDGCDLVAEEFCKEDQRIRVFHRENGGVSAARNLALEEASGEYVTFLDSDDTLESDHIETMVHTAIKENADIVSNRMYFYFNDTEHREIYCSDSIQVLTSAEAVRMMHSEDEAFNGYLMNKLFSIGVIRSVRFDPDIAIHEDMLFLWQAILHSEKIVSQGKYTYHYLMHPTSAINSSYSPRYDTALVAAEEMLSLMQTHFPQYVSYGKKTVLFALLSIANKRYATDCLDRDSWKKLRHKVLFYHDRDACSLIIGLDNRISYRCLLMGRVFFLLWKKIVQIIKK